MDRWRGKVAIVTGAAGGIGSAMVETLLKEDLKVVAVDNNSTRLEELTTRFKNKTKSLHGYLVNVTNDAEVVKFYQKISESLGSVHILINCAGIVRQDTLIEGKTDTWRTVLDTNILGLCIMTRETVKIMRENNIDGHIIHIGSAAGHTVPNFPEINVYPASKFAVRALTETYRQELNRFGLKIKVTCISPGRVDTLIARNNDVAVDKNFDDAPGLEPRDIANCVLYVLSTPLHVQVHEICIKPVGETLV
ncbi:hypothetical protein Zmor_005202 [Zophobas morio]|uniref:Dehydrogenase/reductase SDR family member 11 n=1 Tax=Zophobas morio TaxID=2755281 RepID=A0AA38MKD9_9CUCU|nr:hypothetical protein Zmor_005202 [Zophobas morio]